MLDAIDWEILIWLLAAALSGVGEILTGSYFFIPLVIGAVAAAIAVALGVDIVVVLLVFGSIALAGLGWVLKYAARIRDEPPATHEGARRYVDAEGSVTKYIGEIDAGRVQLGGESWRALSHSGEPISVGTRVRVLEVRGNALVVEPM